MPIEKLIEVRFSDLDPLGHVNNAAYFSYMEEARVAYFRRFPQIKFSPDASFSFIIAELTCQFKSPAYLGELLIIRLSTTESKNSSFIMSYTIEEQITHRLVASGRSVQVCYNYQLQQSIPIPDFLRQALD